MTQIERQIMSITITGMEGETRTLERYDLHFRRFLRGKGDRDKKEAREEEKNRRCKRVGGGAERT